MLHFAKYRTTHLEGELRALRCLVRLPTARSPRRQGAEDVKKST